MFKANKNYHKHGKHSSFGPVKLKLYINGKCANHKKNQATVSISEFMQLTLSNSLCLGSTTDKVTD